MKVVIIIPTYNEADNIGKLIPILVKKFKRLPKHKMYILVVDANSPDGTKDVVLKYSKKYPFVHLLLEKEKQGLGAAYIFAFKHAMKEMKADVVIQMDADFQHDPEKIVEMVEKIDEGYDFVIGSRYVEGGSIPKEWAIYRKLISYGGNLFAKIVLGIFSIYDFTSGFSAVRVKGYLDKANIGTLISEGFAYKMDLLFRLYKLGAKIYEVPIDFGLRDRGDSKMERSNFIDSLVVVLKIRYFENKSLFRFLVVGFAGFGADVVVFNSLRLFLSGNMSSLVSGLIAMTVTFTLNNVWTFSHNKILSKNLLLKSFTIYYVLSYVPIVFRSWLINIASLNYGDTLLVENAAFFIGIVVGLIWNFTVYSRIIWKVQKK